MAAHPIAVAPDFDDTAAAAQPLPEGGPYDLVVYRIVYRSRSRVTDCGLIVEVLPPLDFDGSPICRPTYDLPRCPVAPLASKNRATQAPSLKLTLDLRKFIRPGACRRMSVKVTAGCYGGSMTSNARALLIGELEQSMDLFGQVAAYFTDHRDPRLTEHSLDT